MRKYMNATGQQSIPEYAKTGLDMANLFGVTQNGDKVDYSKFFSTDDKDYWEIEFDMYSKEWKLYYDYEEVGVVMFEDDNDILWNFK